MPFLHFVYFCTKIRQRWRAGKMGLVVGLQIFNEFQVHPTHFTLLLIGKDGYVKLRSKEVVSADYIFSIIDVMPMRMDEVKRKGE